MPSASGAYTSYDLGTANREDLLDVITMISPVETPFFSSVSKGTAEATLHEWPTDELAAAKANTHKEGDDAGTPIANDRARLTNYTQIMTNPFMVSTTQERVKKAGVKSEKAYQAVKSMKEHKRDMEYAAFVNGAKAQGDATTVRTMGGIKEYISAATPDHKVAPSAGANQKLVEDDMADAIEACWNEGGMVDTVLCSAKVKRRITGFVDLVAGVDGAGATQQTIRTIDNSTTKRLSKRIDIYESDFGEVRIVADRYIPITTGTGGSTDVYFLEMGRWSWDFLIKPFQEDLAKTGDAMRAWIYSQGCIAGKAPKGNYCFETVLNSV